MFYFYLKCYSEDIDEDALLSGTPMYKASGAGFTESRVEKQSFTTVRSALLSLRKIDLNRYAYQSGFQSPSLVYCRSWCLRWTGDHANRGSQLVMSGSEGLQTGVSAQLPSPGVTSDTAQWPVRLHTSLSAGPPPPRRYI